MELLIKNGYVYDPLNGVDGEKMDISIRDGKIVESVNQLKAKVIDASGMIVMPGGVDIHSHIAGPKVNAGRKLRPEDHFRDVEPKTMVTRSGVGHTIPSIFTTGYRYARMGYTTVMEPATPPLKTRHTHEELNDIPIIDKSCFPLLGNNWFVMEYLRDGEVEKCAAYVAWILNSLKGYAVKLVNPGGVEAWSWGSNVRDIDYPVPKFGITPREIIHGLCKVNQILHLPHTIHVHTNNLGKPGNYLTTLETMKCVEDLATDDKPVIHITHCQFNAFAGRDWGSLTSGAAEIADYVNKHHHVTLDMGQVIFADTTTMTADGPFQYILHKLSGNKWMNIDVENETGAGIVPYRYKRKNYVNATQWTIGLELALLIKDPWKIFLTTDHPNGGPFILYPRVMTWLLSKRARMATMKRINGRARRRSTLTDIDREYTLYDLAIATRAGTAKALGLKTKGHLGLGADADIAIYRINLAEVDLSRDYKKVRRRLQRAAYTIKDGVIVVKDGEIVKSHRGRTHWTKIEMSTDATDAITADLEDKFENYYTVRLGNYAIDEDYLAVSEPAPIRADV